MKKSFAILLALLCLVSAAFAGQKENTVNLAITANLQSTDGHGIRNLEELYVRAQVYEGLYFFNESKKNLEPRIAESYTVSPDGTVTTFALRKGVKFHNGDLLKASDVVFSLKRAMNLPYWATYMKAVKDVVVADDSHVNVITYAPSASLLSNLSNVYIMSERAITEEGAKIGTRAFLGGTGPYYFDYVDHDQRIVLKAFPEYYRGKPAIDAIVYRPITDQSAASVALEAGELDWLATQASTFEMLKDNPKFGHEIVAANHITYMCINYQSPKTVLENDYLRKAIAHMVDREAMNEAIFNGYATEAYFMENPAYNIAAPTKGITYDYNPEKAKEYLKKAGYPDGVNVGKILSTANNYQRKCAEILQGSLDEIGIEAELEPMETASALQRARKQQFDICVFGYSSTGDFDTFRNRAHTASKGAYYIKFEGNKFDYKKIDSLFEQGVQELNPEKRIAIYEELNNMVADGAVIIPMLYKAQLYVWNANLNVVNAPNFYQVYDWSWKK